MLTKRLENAGRVMRMHTQVTSRNSLGLVSMPKNINMKLVM